jgi:valyl-tRNA synthetase
LRVATADPDLASTVLANEEYIRRLARVDSLEVVEALTEGKASARAVAGPVSIEVPLEGLIDIDAERARLQKEFDRVQKEIGGLTRKLGNPQFVERAPADVVEENRQRLSDYEAQGTRLEESLARLG